MRIRDLLDLTESNTPEPEKRVEKVFEWRHTRVLELGKWALSAAAALALALVASLLKDELKIGRIGEGVLLALVAFFFVSGFLTLLRGNRLQQEYTAALSLLARLATMRTLIQRYRQAGSPRYRISLDEGVKRGVVPSNALESEVMAALQTTPDEHHKRVP